MCENKHFEHLKDFVKSEKTNKLYYVSTNFTFDAGLETMIFEVDNGEIDWEGVFVKRYPNGERAIAEHYKILKNIDNYI